MSTIRVFQGTATASDDGWANDAYYLASRNGLDVSEGVDNCTSWEECSGREGGEEYVEMRSTEAADVVDLLTYNGYVARVA